jgi:secreted Zn-dependent insulinase-like peptidase
MTSAALLLLTAGAPAQTPNTFGTGNSMRFNAKDMDTNGDKMVSKEEMMAYAEKMWDSMANGKDTIRISRATQDFATGGVSFDATAMDTNHDGMISKQEFLAYVAQEFDKMKHTKTMISVQEAAKAFGRGGPPPKQ